ncbi:aminotransferase class I/II-fold pyridoxal phosphate-dependent enzyme [Gammaproteobacteria bacterium]|nr:aminotransferase class I/II-fold pyridoxal phosphate-dependent enzyme [Gammaproteobacteria bacterium]
MYTFDKSFTQQEGIPQAGIDAALALLNSGRLHRYNVEPGQSSEASQFEAELAMWMGQDYCLACASGGYALQIALGAAGLQAGDTVLTNAFTLAPVPGAIHHAGGRVRLVEVDANYCVDLDHLEQQMRTHSPRFFVISHMRGHLADMEAVSALCAERDVILIEDCAHTLGARWNGRLSGTFGRAACFSTQTYKHLNSGEGGVITSDDEALMARAVVMSGSYMNVTLHGAAPPAETIADQVVTTPNCSGRMDNLRAAILRPQLLALTHNIERWNRRYRAIEAMLAEVPGVVLPERPLKEAFVGSSIQFRLPARAAADFSDVVARCRQRGVVLSWFGADRPVGFTSRYDSWQYLDQIEPMPQTRSLLATTLDMRIPLTFSLDDMAQIGAILGEEVTR